MDPQLGRSREGAALVGGLDATLWSSAGSGAAGRASRPEFPYTYHS